MNDVATLELPDDPTLLKQMIVQIKLEAAETIEAMRLRHKVEMDAVLRRFYGPKSEKFDPRQLLIFGIAVADQMPVDEKGVEAESGQKLATRRVRDKHGRGKLPEKLPRTEIVHDLSEEEKACPCCGKVRQCIGRQVSEQLEHVPASLRVIEHVQLKYACEECDQNGEGAQIEMAAKPPQPIEKGLPGPGLLAHVIVSKLGDHLPLYRLEKIFARQEVEIARSTMCAWMLAMGHLVRPLTDLIANRVRQSQAVHTDDTRVPVMAAGQCRSGRIWCYIGDWANPYITYEYTMDRTRAGPQRFLADYKGYLQADAYGGYDGIYHKGNVIEVACWAHARRKFFDAKETDGRRATEMLAMVRDLYAVEDAAKQSVAELLADAPDTQRHERVRLLRQEQSVRILAKIKTWLDAEKQRVLPRSPMAAAMTYTLNQWEALCRYVEQGYLNIDNNAAERALKRVAIGRKNWLFAGHDEAGQSHARLWTLIASAERHGIDPQRYLTSVLAKIGQTKLSELNQFLPDVWKADDAAEPKTGAPIAASQTGPPK